MFDTIIYPTDFSDSAHKSLAHIKALKRAGANRVVIINVIHQRILDTLDTMQKALYFQDGRFQGDPEKNIEALVADRQEKMAPIIAELKDAGFEVASQVLEGYPVKEILKAEKETGTCLIVMGSHGRNNFRRARIGSVSEKVIRRSVNPVLLIKR